MDENRHCCFTCVWFEQRSGFCRFNPPIPVAINDGNCTHTIAMWPKISAPHIDWCRNYSDMNLQLLV